MNEHPQHPQQLPQKSKVTRAERLATYTPKVRKLRVALLAVGIPAAVLTGLFVVLFIIAAIVLVFCTATLFIYCAAGGFTLLSAFSSPDSADAAALFGWLTLINVSIWLAFILDLASLVIGILLVRERRNSPGTTPGIVAIVFGALFSILPLLSIVPWLTSGN